MKLKKIASLMLAGVMAVSMLAGCSTTSNNGNSGEGEGEGEGTATSAYSATLKENMPKAVKDMENVTFQDNADDRAALEDALGNLSSTTLAQATILPQTATNVNAIPNWSDDFDLVASDFIDTLGFKDGDLDPADLSFVSIQNRDTNVTRKDGAIYVVDGTVDINKALKQVAADLDDKFAALPDESDGVVNDELHYTYDYTISVSVVNKALAPFAGYSASANFIAVTVTRVPTAA